MSRGLLVLVNAFPVLLSCAGGRSFEGTGSTAHNGVTAAEVPACEFLPEEDRETDPFLQPRAIAGVVPFEKRDLRRGGNESQAQGATVVFRPVQGLTVERLQALVDCTLARHALLHLRDSGSPLALQGVRARVASAGNGFAVILESEDPRLAQEIARRARAIERDAAR